MGISNSYEPPTRIFAIFMMIYSRLRMTNVLPREREEEEEEDRDRDSLPNLITFPEIIKKSKYHFQFQQLELMIRCNRHVLADH